MGIASESGARVVVRVLHGYSGNLNGGIESLLKTLSAQRHLCDAMEPGFALCFDDALANELRATGSPVFLLGEVRIRRPWTLLRARHSLAQLLERQRFDAVICHGSWPHLVMAPVVRAANIPLVYWRHDASDGRHWTDRWAARTIPDLVICNSHFTETSFERTYPGVRRAILYYPSSEPKLWSQEELLETRAKLTASAKNVVIVLHSRMESWKGHRNLLQALHLLKSVPGWICWIAGAPQRPKEKLYFEELQAEAQRYGIADRMRFLGWVEEVPRLLAAAQIHCQPNKAPEPFGICFIEAMSAGLPVVSMAFGGSAEIVTGDSGILVPPHDPQALAGSLRKLIRDPELRAKLGAGGRVRARSLCDPEKQLNRLAGILKTAVAAGRTA
jgi:glycosyltransferase involved in cell wall biosynthesis